MTLVFVSLLGLVLIYNHCSLYLFHNMAPLGLALEKFIHLIMYVDPLSFEQELLYGQLTTHYRIFLTWSA